MIRLTIAFCCLMIYSIAAGAPAHAASNTAIFAGGCFWCVESDFDHVKGDTSTVSGYIGGDAQNPTYRNHEGFREAVEIKFDPSKTSYKKLLDVFWRTINPTDSGGAFCDRGHSYTTAIYAMGDQEFKQAKASKAKTHKVLGKPIATKIKRAKKFWRAEDYHQNFYKKSASHYKYYRSACGRDAQVKAIWGDQAYRGVEAH